MWIILLAGLLAAAAIHARLTAPRAFSDVAELFLVYLLAGYCGISQIAMAFATLFAGDHVAAHVGVPAGNPIQIWAGFLLLGAGIIATLTIWVRGSYVLAPVIVWSIFWAGATYAHIYTYEKNGVDLSPTAIAQIFATHGLVAVLLVGAFFASRLRRHRA